MAAWSCSTSPVVELEDERAVRDETFVLGSAVSALAAEERLVPAAARFDVAYRDEWLWSHDPMLGRSGPSTSAVSRPACPPDDATF
jgi:hypothetical protein